MGTPDCWELVYLTSYYMLAHLGTLQILLSKLILRRKMGWALDVHCHLTFTAAIISILQRKKLRRPKEVPQLVEV